LGVAINTYSRNDKDVSSQKYSVKYIFVFFNHCFLKEIGDHLIDFLLLGNLTIPLTQSFECIGQLWVDKVRIMVVWKVRNANGRT